MLTLPFSLSLTPARSWNSVFLLFNIALGAYILGTITLLVVKSDERTGRYRDMSSNLKTYSTLNRLPQVRAGCGRLRRTGCGCHRTHMPWLLLTARTTACKQTLSDVRALSCMLLAGAGLLTQELKDEMQEHLRLKFNNQEASDEQVRVSGTAAASAGCCAATMSACSCSHGGLAHTWPLCCALACPFCACSMLLLPRHAAWPGAVDLPHHHPAPHPAPSVPAPPALQLPVQVRARAMHARSACGASGNLRFCTSCTL